MKLIISITFYVMSLQKLLCAHFIFYFYFIKFQFIIALIFSFTLFDFGEVLGFFYINCFLSGKHYKYCSNMNVDNHRALTAYLSSLYFNVARTPRLSLRTQKERPGNLKWSFDVIGSLKYQKIVQVGYIQKKRAFNCGHS